MGDGLDAAEVVFQGDVLVGGVGVFVGQAEAEEHAGHLEGVVHLGDEGDGAALADEDGLLAETLLQGALRDLEDGGVERSDPGLAGAEGFELHLH